MPIPPIVCISGKKNCGKTTFLEKLIAELTRRGVRIAVIKHDRHGFEMDVEGKDTWRHKRAGAWATVISSPRQVGLVMDVDRELELEELAERFHAGADLVLAEGFSRTRPPKIEIFRPEQHETWLLGPDQGLVAMVADADVDPGVPVFPLDDAPGVADFIQQHFLPARPAHSPNAL